MNKSDRQVDNMFVKYLASKPGEIAGENPLMRTILEAKAITHRNVTKEQFDHEDFSTLFAMTAAPGWELPCGNIPEGETWTLIATDGHVIVVPYGTTYIMNNEGDTIDKV